MKLFIAIIDSLLNAFTPRELPRLDPTLYQVETRNNQYYGYIIFQNDVMIKFRTVTLKPVKILKSNIVKVSIANEMNSISYFMYSL
jgi:hypothetical protein